MTPFQIENLKKTELLPNSNTTNLEQIGEQSRSRVSAQEIHTHPKLGLVCITSSKEIRFRTMTRTRYLKLSLAEREAALKELYLRSCTILNKLQEIRV